ncbi:MAG: hypothetical protein JSU05_02155 [Bacteroidetes bacterium]|nr:hypothetical protein [Bacteroidota bacterium]
MKLKTFNPKFLLPVMAVAGISLSLVAWQKSPDRAMASKSTFFDTIPKENREKKVRNLDDVIDQLDAAEMSINMQKVQKEIDEAMKNIDVQKMKIDMQKAMQEVDVEKIKKEVEESVARIDWDKMKQQMAEVQKIDMNKLDKEMKDVQNQMEKLKPELEKTMQKAKKQMAKAKAEMMEYKSFTEGLEKDGLISKKDGYTLKHKDGEFFINGTKQPESVYNKYKTFLEKHKSFTIKQTDDDFDIEND